MSPCVLRSLSSVRCSKAKYVVWTTDSSKVAILGKHSEWRMHVCACMKVVMCEPVWSAALVKVCLLVFVCGVVQQER